MIVDKLSFWIKKDVFEAKNRENVYKYHVWVLGTPHRAKLDSADVKSFDLFFDRTDY